MTTPSPLFCRIARNARTLAAALALSVAGTVHAAGELLDSIQLTDFRIAYTSGTMVMQEVRAAGAWMAGDGESLLSRDVEVTVIPPDDPEGPPVKIRSPLARYYFAAPAGPDIPEPEGALDTLRRLAASNALDAPEPGVVQPVRRDIILTAGENGDGVTMDLAGRGSIVVRHLVWSEAHARFLSLDGFEQMMTMPDGRMSLVGDAFITDRSFEEWLYPVLGSAPLTLRFRPSEGAGGGESSFIGQVAGGGELLFETAAYADGRPGELHLAVDPETGAQKFDAEGHVRLETPELALDSESLVYQPAASTDTPGVLKASRRVSIRTPQMEAIAGDLVIDLATQDLQLSGYPRVSQTTEQAATTFDGMREFTVRADESGGRLVEMTGPREIKATIEPRGEQKPGTEQPAAAPGLTQLGGALALTVAPRTGLEPILRSRLDEAGELASLFAEGSVLLETEQFSMRCDEFRFDAAAGQIEAIGNVYIRQEGITADCGRLVYELAGGRMTMSQNPDIVRTEPGGTTRIWGCDTFIIEPQPDGDPDIQAIGEDCKTLFTPTPSAGDANAQPQPAGAGLLGRLSNGGEVFFSTGRLADGTAGSFSIRRDRETGEQVFEARGRLRLETPQFNLQSDALNFREAQRRLAATGSVMVRTPDFEATARDLSYNIANGEITLTGEPRVVQETRENRAEFTGMEMFIARPTEDSRRLVELTGTREIVIDFRPAGENAGAPAGGNAQSPAGLEQLGESLNIRVSPRPDQHPRVRTILSPENDMEVFSASGSIVLKSTRFDLRSDELTYNAPTQRFEAVGNVYVKQEQMQADCGRLNYDLASGRVTLTINPEVLVFREDGISRTTGCDVVTVQPREGGYPEVATLGDRCRNILTPYERPAPNAAPQQAERPAVEVAPAP